MSKQFVFPLLLAAALFLKPDLMIAADGSSSSDRATDFSTQLSEMTPSPTEAPAQDAHFIPLDVAPKFSDLQYLLSWRAADFEKLFPILSEDSFAEINEATALSNHDISWGEIAQFVTSIGITTWEELQLYLGSNEKAHDYFIFQEATGTFLAKPEWEQEPAYLPRETFEYYANWRELRYYCYQQLQADKVAAAQGLEAEEINGGLTTYLRRQGLLPAVDFVHGTDHLEEILMQSVSIEMDLEKITSRKNSYRLATTEEIEALPNNNVNKVASINHDGYGRLAINIVEMKSQPGFEKREQELQQEKENNYQFLRASNQEATEATKKSEEQTRATLSPALKVMGGMTMAVGTLLQLPWDLATAVVTGGLSLCRAAGEVGEATIVVSPSRILKEIQTNYKILRSKDEFHPIQITSMRNIINQREGGGTDYNTSSFTGQQNIVNDLKDFKNVFTQTALPGTYLYKDQGEYVSDFAPHWENMMRRLQREKLLQQEAASVRRQQSWGKWLMGFGGISYMLGDQLGTSY